MPQLRRPRPAEAEASLGVFRGGAQADRWQSVMTGLCLVSNPKGRVRTALAVTRLKFKTIPEKQLDRLARKNHDKSGAYAIQKMNDRFVRKIEGELDNVIGLPVKLVKKLLRPLRHL